MRKTFITFLLAAFFCTSAQAEEDKDENNPDVSIGITAVIGSFNLTEKDTGIKKEPGLVTGAGLSIEKMIGEHTGIGTGIQYRYFYLDFEMKDSTNTIDARWTFQSINIPIFMIFSLGGDESSINFAGGIVYSHIIYSVMTTDSDLALDTKKDNAMKYTNADQIGLTAGIYFRFKATDFTDFILGITGEYYPTNLLYDRGGGSDRMNMFNYNLYAGYMFRTCLFPGSSD
jgi:hypothetical protein